MGSGHADTAATGVQGVVPPPASRVGDAPVIAAGAGVRYGNLRAIRIASFRLASTELGCGTLGIVAPRSATSATLVDLLSGRIAPSYGELRVLGQDMRTARGRMLARRQCGVVGRHARHFAAPRLRDLLDHAARPFVAGRADRQLLVAAILDRLALEPWADVPLHAAPELIARKARLAAACVHQPKLLILDGLLDHLDERDLTALAAVMQDLERDAAIVVFGDDMAALTMACQRVLTIAGGIVTDAPIPVSLPHPRSVPVD
jgi:ABC-type multidrug transport system ATPase subunit